MFEVVIRIKCEHYSALLKYLSKQCSVDCNTLTTYAHILNQNDEIGQTHCKGK